MANVMSAPGAPAPAAPPLGQSLLPNLGQPGGWQAWVSQPQNRAALVQAGIALLQPTGVGQSTAGHIGSAIGSGLEARDRVVSGQQEAAQRATENAIAQQEANARATAANAAQVNADRQAALGGLTMYQALMMDERKKKSFIQFAQKRAADSQFSTEPLDLSDPETQEKLAQEYQSLLNSAGGTSPTPVPGAPQTTLGDALPAAPAPAVAAPGDVPEGATATGPNGAKLVRRNGQWVPM